MSRTNNDSAVSLQDLNIRSRSDTWALGRESNRETDGVDIYDSSYVTLHSLRISNGDDCMSFKVCIDSHYASFLSL